MPADRRADAIVVAAGASSRMGGRDKLAREVGGRPVVARALDALVAVEAVERIVLVTSAERVTDLRAAAWLPERVVAVVPGGSRRHESVAAGLAALDALDSRAGSAATDRVVLVHDGARPLTSPALVSAVLEAAERTGAAIPVVPVAETIKRLAGDHVAATVDRTDLAAAQTPQGARRSLLRAAFERFPPAGPETWTDEAALLEACRIPVHVIPGEPGNLKVTLPADLQRVEAALAVTGDAVVVAGGAPRVGAASDAHPFGPGSPLALGGIEIAGPLRLHGHSDGDVALHAVAGAILGAAGLGDLGHLFPAGPATPAGIASGEMLGEVRRRVAAAGFRPAAVDLTIVAARPRLAGRLDEMRAAIAALLGLPADAVGVKASTGNLSGMEGAGRGIAAHAVATLEPIR